MFPCYLTWLQNDHITYFLSVVITARLGAADHKKHLSVNLWALKRVFYDNTISLHHPMISAHLGRIPDIGECPNTPVCNAPDEMLFATAIKRQAEARYGQYHFDLGWDEGEGRDDGICPNLNKLLQRS